MKTIRIGIYGLWRGASFLGPLKDMEGVQVAALCEKEPAVLDPWDPMGTLAD